MSTKISKRIALWFQKKCEKLTPKQHQVLFWLLFIMYVLLTFWVVGALFFERRVYTRLLI